METVIAVRGMTCGGCAGSVERVLKTLPGVQAVTVKLDAASATVVHADSGPQRAEMLKAVEQAGFEAA
jgi:copper chaperone CopZ